jgi:TonB family protein
MYTFTALAGLSRIAEQQKNSAAAEQFLVEAARAQLGLPTELRALNELAQLYSRNNKHAEAAVTYGKVANLWGDAAGRKNAGLARYLMEKGSAESRGGLPMQAEQTFRESLAILKDISQDRTAFAYIVLGSLGNALSVQGKPEAAAVIAEAGAGLEKLMGRVLPEIARTMGPAFLKEYRSASAIPAPTPPTTAPQPLSMPQPGYTNAARKARITGAITAWLRISESGSVENVWVVKPLGLGLDEQVIDVLSKWRFRPAMRSGTPTATEFQTLMNFYLY